jgi:hypothetical protein
MSIDYTNNNYVKVGNYSNVVNEIPNNRAAKHDVSNLHEQLEDLIYKLAMKHPEWQFVGVDSWFNATKDAFIIKRLRVYEQQDELGVIDVDTWRDVKFEIKNSRISKAMAKRNYKSTKDVNKALKLVEQFFSSKTLKERVHEAVSRVGGDAQQQEWAMRRGFDQLWSTITPALASYVVLNLDALRPALELHGAPGSVLDKLPEANEKLKVIRTVTKARQQSDGTTVLLHGDRYVVIPDAGPEPQVLTTSQLTDDMRTKLGILKMVGDGDAVESFGMRINATTFYLLP